MGCYNTSGFISRLQIRCNDDVVVIPCAVSNGDFNASNHYTMSQLTPLSLPIFGKYDDYGCITDIEDTPSAKAWAKCVSSDIEKSLKVFERASVNNNTIKDTVNRETEFDGEKKFKDVEEGLLEAFGCRMKVCLIFEHRKVYEELASKEDRFNNREYFKDVASFKKSLLGIPSICDMDNNITYRSPFIMIPNGESSVQSLEKYVDLSKRYFNKHKGNGSTITHRFLNIAAIYLFSAYDSTIWDIDGIDKAFADFCIFNFELMFLNVGYSVPSCNCGGDNDYSSNVVKFNEFLRDFYDAELKDDEEWDEDDEEDEDSEE